MYTRSATPPDFTFFLLGPRGTGKTTWLRQVLPGAHAYDLLEEGELVRLARDPGRFSAEVSGLPDGSWVVVDEVQRLPAILDEVHRLIARDGQRVRFALTGSSARKLVRGGANLLPGRAVNRRFFPLTSDEVPGILDPEDWLRFGGLPSIRTAPIPLRIALLDAYLANYVTQEVRAEAMVQDIGSFLRFLEIAARMNGQVVNVAGISRDAAVARPTVQGYFQALVDTLVGVWLPAIRPRAKVKETGHPKFYFFDPGVVRSATGMLRESLDSAEWGPLLETWVLGEVRAFIDRHSVGGELGYWRTPSGTEVDLVWRRGARAVAIEVKASDRWRSEYGRAFDELESGLPLERAVGAYLGNRRERHGRIDVFPIAEFFQALHAGEIIPK